MLFFFLLFLQDIQNPVIFLAVSIIATSLPDMDNRFSKIGHYRVSRIFNFFMKHRGAIHSFTFLAILSVLIFVLFKEILPAFFLGYSLHLFADSFTLSGIMPLYPIKWKIKGRIKTGGIGEFFLFLFFVAVDFLLLFSKIYLIVK
jgi:membrane-bound metal-dependent hydrolase YbcI (DUF457 family)